MKMSAKQFALVLDRAIEWAAGSALAGAFVFAIVRLGPSQPGQLMPVAIVAGVAAFVCSTLLLRAVSPRQPVMRRFHQAAWPANLSAMPSAGVVGAWAEDALLLDTPLAAEPVAAAACDPDGDELLLDAPVDGADSTVVHLFDERRAPMPTAGELKARIDRHLDQRDAPASVVPMPIPAPATVGADAGDALNAALAELRRSLQRGGAAG